MGKAKIGGQIYNVQGKVANNDAAWGPWTNTTEALTKLAAMNQVVEGKTVGIKQTNGGIVEYWLQPGTNGLALVEKGAQTGAGGTVYTKSETNTLLAEKLTSLTSNLRGVFHKAADAADLQDELEEAFEAGDTTVNGSQILIIDPEVATSGDSMKVLTFDEDEDGYWKSEVLAMNIRPVTITPTYTAADGGDQIATFMFNGVQYNLYAPPTNVVGAISLDTSFDSNPQNTRVPSTKLVKDQLDLKATKTEVTQLSTQVSNLSNDLNGETSDVTTDVTTAALASEVTAFMGEVWNYGENYASSKYTIPSGTQKIKVKANSSKVASVTFMKIALPTASSWPASSVTANCSTIMNGATKIDIQPNQERIFELNGDEVYLYIKKSSSTTGWEPSNVSLINTNTISEGLKKEVDDMKDSIEENSDAIEDINDAIEDIPAIKTATDSLAKVEKVRDVTEKLTLRADIGEGMVNADGTLATGSQYRHISVDVEEGDVVTIKACYISSQGTPVYDPTSQKMYYRAVCCKKDGVVIPDKGFGITWSGTIESFEVPSGVDEIIISTASYPYSYQSLMAFITGKEHSVVYRKVDNDGNPLTWKGNIASGSSIALPCTNVRGNTTFALSAKIGSFSSIVIGTNYRSPYGSPAIVITPTQVEVKSYVASTYNKTFSHGLTITNDIQVIIMRQTNVGTGTGKVIIRSNGSEWSLSEGDADFSVITNWGDSLNGYVVIPTLEGSTDNVLTDVAMSMSIQDIGFETWVFGDSWVSMYDSRWPYYLYNIGIKRFLLDGWAGRTSQQAIESFRTLIAIRQPKRVLWLLGMNDLDTDQSTYNESWKSCLDEVKATCDRYGITLILATIPNVPADDASGRRHMTAKNAYVRSCGLRYVDQEKALGADNDGVWSNAAYYQSTTNKTHTSAVGAKALAARFLADVPELSYN